MCHQLKKFSNVHPLALFSFSLSALPSDHDFAKIIKKILSLLVILHTDFIICDVYKLKYVLNCATSNLDLDIYQMKLKYFKSILKSRLSLIPS